MGTKHDRFPGPGGLFPLFLALGPWLFCPRAVSNVFLNVTSKFVVTMYVFMSNLQLSVVGSVCRFEWFFRTELAFFEHLELLSLLPSHSVQSSKASAHAGSTLAANT